MKKLTALIIAAQLFFAWLAFPRLPELMPVHWNFRGQIDSYMPKLQAALMMPVMSVVMAVLFAVLPNIDPKNDKYRLFAREWQIIQTGFMAFFAWMQFIIFYVSLNPAAKMMPLMFIGLGALFILLGNYLSKIRQNYFIGIKIPWTLSSEDNWNKTHRYASWTFVAAGILTLAESYFIWYAPAVIFGSIMLATVLPVIYSFLLYKKAAYKMKYVYAALLFVILAVSLLRLTGPEDTWICSGGTWVRHGSPAQAAPSTPCR
ncbi:hypothetical protein A2Z33_05835 [Candidatus Gottesmanbacteria bacterium RBG_16_52_11]|uniref:DUF1648 domain-containing protein n=1 Tax=Candidatus Gottesmanbacteria bacterium RBG_16_52_11 TaxID=1798374 RepID=A0A1F5YY34_9BACT|nr:MAG: hypothetical protein A2Z33_05835 [Candidatus Gottesmanbacteria bacterium RBG_16_52_11]